MQNVSSNFAEEAEKWKINKFDVKQSKMLQQKEERKVTHPILSLRPKPLITQTLLDIKKQLRTLREKEGSHVDRDWDRNVTSQNRSYSVREVTKHKMQKHKEEEN